MFQLVSFENLFDEDDRNPAFEVSSRAFDFRPGHIYLPCICSITCLSSGQVSKKSKLQLDCHAVYPCMSIIVRIKKGSKELEYYQNVILQKVYPLFICKRITFKRNPFFFLVFRKNNKIERPYICICTFFQKFK